MSRRRQIARRPLTGTETLPPDRAEILGGNRDGEVVELTGDVMRDRTRKPVGHEREAFTVGGFTERRFDLIERDGDGQFLYVLGTHRWPEGRGDPY